MVGTIPLLPLFKLGSKIWLIDITELFTDVICLGDKMAVYSSEITHTRYSVFYVV